MPAFIILILIMLTQPSVTLAGEAENIGACIKSVKEYSGIDVDEFDANYEGKLLGFSKTKWDGITCDVKLSTVHNLTINGKKYIVDTFSGIDAKNIFSQIEKDTEEAVSLLESRIKLLEQRLKKSEKKLKLVNPDVNEIKEYIANGISKATGK